MNPQLGLTAWTIVKVALFVLLGSWILRTVTLRLTKDRTLQRLMLVCYGVRVALGLTLFFISWFRLPILRNLQANLGGFWMFAIDGTAYHY